MIVKITCTECNAAFELTEKHHFEKAMSCPNCGASFPNEALNDLINLTNAYNMCMEDLKIEDDLGTSTPFELTFLG